MKTNFQTFNLFAAQLFFSSCRIKGKRKTWKVPNSVKLPYFPNFRPKLSFLPIGGGATAIISSKLTESSWSSSVTNLLTKLYFLFRDSFTNCQINHSGQNRVFSRSFHKSVEILKILLEDFFQVTERDSFRLIDMVIMSDCSQPTLSRSSKLLEMVARYFLTRIRQLSSVSSSSLCPHLLRLLKEVLGKTIPSLSNGLSLLRSEMMKESF